MSDLYGAIEGGGTKFVCGIGDARGSRETTIIPTRDPAATFAAVGAFFAAGARHGPLKAIGLASFGPMELDRAAPDYGRILRTPKTAWVGADLIAHLRAFTDRPIGLDTDVNGAARAEADAAGLSDLAYVTVGTGVGVGIVSRGQIVSGAGHPEVGHLLIRPHPGQEGFAGICPFHGTCIEGLASGPAMRAAWGVPAERLPPGHPAWDIQADYLAQLCMTLVLTVVPARIVLGGGVMQQDFLRDAIRARTRALLGGYVAKYDSDTAMAGLITAPQCTEPPGLVGAYLLAAEAAARLS